MNNSVISNIQVVAQSPGKPDILNTDSQTKAAPTSQLVVPGLGLHSSWTFFFLLPSAAQTAGGGRAPVWLSSSHWKIHVSFVFPLKTRKEKNF